MSPDQKKQAQSAARKAKGGAGSEPASAPKSSSTSKPADSKPAASTPKESSESNAKAAGSDWLKGSTSEERSDWLYDRKNDSDYTKQLRRANKIVKAMENAPPPHPEEVAAAIVYTGSAYAKINSLLRGDRNRFNPTPEEEKQFREDARLTAAALANLPPYQGTVYRGSDVPQSVLDSYRVGEIASDRGFVSSSANVDVTNKFRGSGAEGTTPVSYVIQSRTGRSVQNLSSYPKEEEVLFAPDTQFRVLQIEQGDTTTIYMEEI
jgi:hypothetical protein